MFDDLEALAEVLVASHLPWGRYWFLFAGHGQTILFSEIFLCSFAAVCWNFLQKFLLSSSKIRQLQGNLQRR